MADIKVPFTLKNFNLFIDGRGYAGRVDEVTLPKLTAKSEEHRAGGHDTPIEIDMGMDKLELSGTLSQFDWETLKQFGIFNAKNTLFTIRGSLHDDSDPNASIPVVCVCRGGIKEIDSGTFKAGEKTQLKFTASLKYYKLSINGEDIHEIDAMNLVRKINGVDQMEKIRADIGL